MIRDAMLLLLLAALGALVGCSTPQIVQATDCRGAASPCGTIAIDQHAMTPVMVTAPVSALPGAH
jgi:hypothetical protein